MKKPGRLYAGVAVLMLLVAAIAVFVVNMVHAQQANKKSTRISIVEVGTTHSYYPCRWYCSTPTATVPTQPGTPTPSPILAQTSPPTPTATSGTGYTDSSAAAQAVLTLINQERASMNLPALQMSNALISSSHLHNLAMLAAHQLSHQLPGEAALGTRISAQDVKWTMVAENIGYSFGDATQTAVSLNQSMFAEKPPNDGHRQNILSNANIVGIDVIVDTQNSQVWLTEDFARTA